MEKLPSRHHFRKRKKPFEWEVKHLAGAWKSLQLRFKHLKISRPDWLRIYGHAEIDVCNYTEMESHQSSATPVSGLYPCIRYVHTFTLKPTQTKRQHVCLFFQSRQYHYLTFLLMRVLMSPMRFVLAPLCILQVEAAATSAVQRSTHLVHSIDSMQRWQWCCITSVYSAVDINYVNVHTGRKSGRNYPAKWVSAPQ